MRKDLVEEVVDKEVATTVTMSTLLDNKKDASFYSALRVSDVKRDLIMHFLSLFCENREVFPKIEISRYENEILKETTTISCSDVPTPAYSREFFVKYSKLDKNNKVVSANREEKFNILSFEQNANGVNKNILYFVSKGALAHQENIDNLSPKDSIDGKRYLFLLRSNYFNNIDDDARGNLHLVKESDFRKQNECSLFPEECLLGDHIREESNRTIAAMYPKFLEKKTAALDNLEKLKGMFLLDEKSISKIRKNLKSSQSDEEILNLIYKTDSEISAKGDAELKKYYENIKRLNPADKDYQIKLSARVKEFATLIPLRNKIGLTKYVARRKLVLDIFQHIIERELDNYSRTGHINEEVFHNLVFQQNSTMDQSNHDLWLLSDEYVYFQGSSDCKLKDILNSATL